MSMYPIPEIVLQDVDALNKNWELADTMPNHWSGEVMLNGGQLVQIWWTCWPSIKSMVKYVASISSDLPKVEFTGGELVIKINKTWKDYLNTVK